MRFLFRRESITPDLTWLVARHCDEAEKVVEINID
jgi:hypothetical protein